MTCWFVNKCWFSLSPESPHFSFKMVYESKLDQSWEWLYG